MKRGSFITLEGGEGAGKSTQARLLVSALMERGISAILTREPGGTPGGEAIRHLLLHPPSEVTDEGGWNARTEALLFAAARADHVANLIDPALEEGRWVVCDRFIDSTRAYQGGGGGLSDKEILSLHEIGSDGLLPDLTLLLELPAEVASARVGARDRGENDAIAGRSHEYHSKVANAFRELAEANPDRFVVIDGNASPDEIHLRVMEAVEPLLEARK